MVSRVIPVDPFDLVVFGGTGDLARRKIIPALFRRYCSGQIVEGSQIIGAARSDLDRAGFQQLVAAAIREFSGGRACEDGTLDRFLEMLRYVQLNAKGEEGWPELTHLFTEDRTRAFYLSVGPSLFGDIAGRIRTHGLVNADTRIVVEKPFGHDLDSARALNATLAQHFDEHQAQAVDIATVVDDLTPRLLGRQIVRGPEDLAGTGQPRPGQRPGDAEVGDVGVAVTVDEDIRRLQVAMNDILAMRLGQGVGDLANDGGGPLDVELACGPQNFLQ